jgi:hypothetical protein
MRQSRVTVRADGWTANLLETDEAQARGPSLWDRILGLVEEDLAQRRERKIFVRAPDGAGSYEEIGDLSTEQLRRLNSGLHGWVAEQLLDRYLAEGGYVDLLEKRRAYTKKIDDLVPENLPALVEADRVKAEEHFEERDRVRFAAEVHRDLEQLGVVGYVRTVAERELTA